MARFRHRGFRRPAPVYGNGEPVRIVATPLAETVLLPPLSRPGGVVPGLLDALVTAPGVDHLREQLSDPDVVVVTTGQQPGLFTGPMYTVHKAISAAALAAELQQRWDRRVVPVFWSAGDDHDYAEARWASWLDLSGELVTVSLPDRPGDAPLTPMSRLMLPDEVAGLLDQLEQCLPPSPNRDATLSWLRRHFAPGHSLGAANAGALAELLAPLGIACFDSTHAAAKRTWCLSAMEAT